MMVEIREESGILEEENQFFQQASSPFSVAYGNTLGRKTVCLKSKLHSSGEVPRHVSAALASWL